MTDQEKIIGDWNAAKHRLDKAKKEESELRLKVAELFPNEKESGTETIDLANDWKLKQVIKLNYTLDKAATPAALEQIDNVTADRLVTWSPKLSTAEYKRLTPEQKAIIDEVLTIKPGAPTITLVAPKG
jgi:hypothetical protein